MIPKKEKAVALCRVSSDEQLKNHSLARQNAAVMRMAEKLGVEIPQEYVWSGSVSSKRGKNMKRKDLNEIYAACKRDKAIKYVIVDEPDRFMRSIKEAFAWETNFDEIGVKVMYTDEQLNGDDLFTKMQRFIKYFQAEGSNEERIKKTVEGHKQAIAEGRYPFVPPLGYRKGSVSGIPEVDPDMGPLLKTQLVRIAKGLVTPTAALRDFNNSVKLAGLNKAFLKMDKWRTVCTNPFYCGILEIHKVIDAYNPNGLHEKLITKAMHERIVEVFNGKPKNQKGPHTSGNPLYPFSQMITHIGCPCTVSKYNKFVGVTVKNNQGKEYNKYRCRGCYMSMSMEEMRDAIYQIVSSMKLTEHGYAVLRDSLTEVYEQEAGDLEAQEVKLYSQRKQALSAVDNLTDKLIVETSEVVKEALRRRIEDASRIVKACEKSLEELEEVHTADLARFTDYALNYVRNLVDNVMKLSPYKMQLCKQLLFPDGFYVDENKNVYTTKVSPLYRLVCTKNDSFESKNSLMVRMKRL